MRRRVRFLDRSGPPHILTLVLATSLGALSLNVFLPSLPGIAEYYQTDYVIVQLAVTLYLLSNAILMLVIGPLSDRYGRRPVMFYCIFISLLATSAALLAPTIQWFLIARMIQGTAVAGMVLGRAIIRDMVGPEEAASKIGYVTMAMAVIPMIAPMLGGYMDELFGWRSTFWLMDFFTIAVLIVIWLDLGETNRHPTGGVFAQFRSYPLLFGSQRFWLYTLASAFSAGIFFAFLGGGPYLAVNWYGLSPSQYGAYFAFLPAGYFAGNFLSGRFAIRAGINRMMIVGCISVTFGMLFAIALNSAGIDNALAFFSFMTFVGIGNGLVLPSANAGIVSVRPELAGAASGVGGFFQIGGGALLSVLGGAFLSPDSGPLPLLLVMLISSIVALALTLAIVKIARSRGELELVAED